MEKEKRKGIICATPLVSEAIEEFERMEDPKGHALREKHYNNFQKEVLEKIRKGNKRQSILKWTIICLLSLILIVLLLLPFRDELSSLKKAETPTEASASITDLPSGEGAPVAEVASPEEPSTDTPEKAPTKTPVTSPQSKTSEQTVAPQKEEKVPCYVYGNGTEYVTKEECDYLKQVNARAEKITEEYKECTADAKEDFDEKIKEDISNHSLWVKNYNFTIQQCTEIRDRAVKQLGD